MTQRKTEATEKEAGASFSAIDDARQKILMFPMSGRRLILPLHAITRL